MDFARFAVDTLVCVLLRLSRRLSGGVLRVVLPRQLPRLSVASDSDSDSDDDTYEDPLTSQTGEGIAMDHAEDDEHDAG